MKTEQAVTSAAVSVRSSILAAITGLQRALRKAYGKQAPAVLVYGSYARGEEFHRLRDMLAAFTRRCQILISVMLSNRLWGKERRSP